MEPYEILTGVGTLYTAPVGTAFPDVEDAPGVAWRALGDTQDGVTVTLDQKIDEVRVDQETGPMKASRSEESIVLETTLAEATLENLAEVLGAVVEDTAAGSGTVGTREVPLYRGGTVATRAFLFRGQSAYGAFNAQYELPYGYFGGPVEMKDTKDGNRAIGVEFHALVDHNASTDADKFGRLVMQDAVALP